MININHNSQNGLFDIRGILDNISRSESGDNVKRVGCNQKEAMMGRDS